MNGRSGFCLLAVLSMLVAPAMTGQSERSISRQLPATALSDIVPQPPHAGQTDLRSFPRPPRLPSSPPSPLRFPQFARTAGLIFSGTVKSVQRGPAIRGQGIETVAITFHVENAIRGATPGEDLVISQWIGLWSAGQRYRVGERLLVFFYPPSKLGLTSSVGGPMGRFAVDSAGHVLLTAQHLAAFQRDPVLGGKSRVRVSDFALAVRQATTEEE